MARLPADRSQIAGVGVDANVTGQLTGDATATLDCRAALSPRLNGVGPEGDSVDARKHIALADRGDIQAIRELADRLNATSSCHCRQLRPPLIPFEGRPDRAYPVAGRVSWCCSFGSLSFCRRLQIYHSQHAPRRAFGILATRSAIMRRSHALRENRPTRASRTDCLLCGPRPGIVKAEARRPRRVRLPRPTIRPLVIMRRAPAFAVVTPHNQLRTPESNGSSGTSSAREYVKQDPTLLAKVKTLQVAASVHFCLHSSKEVT
jgi:hypothetical protein